MEQIESELEDKIVFYVPREDAKLYEKPEEWFPLTSFAFPSALLDIEEACKCYALERYTACVFHAMAVVQTGLYTMAHDLGVTLKYPVQSADWHEIIVAIEGKIEPLRQLSRSHPQRDELLTFYSGCASQFRYFKDGWRNPVAHMRELYKRPDAYAILSHVRDFMELLSTRLHE